MSTFFGKGNSEPFNWISVESLEELDRALSSNEKPKLFFKHSTRCGISVMALKTFEKQWTETNVDCDLYYVDLLMHRDVSNKLEALTEIKHESPQVLVMINDKLVYNASHSSIDVRQVEKKIEHA